MPSSLPNKKALSEAAEGPPWVRSLAGIQALGLGRTVRGLYDRWFESQQERRRRVEDAGAVAAFVRQRPSLDPVQQGVIDQLVDRGIATVAVDALTGSAAWRERLQALVGPWLASDEVRAAERAYRESESRRWKDYLVRMYGRDAAIELSSPWLQFAVQPAVLDVVNAYLGMLSRILYVDVWDTVPLVHEGPNMGSQRWHRDPEDAKLVKVFLYFSDVGDDAGPMEYVPHSRKGERYGNLWPQRFPKGSVPPPDEFEAAVPPGARVRCAHPAGTLLFVDTAGFHRGGRATRERRVLATWTYTRPSSVWPRAYRVVRTASGTPLSAAGEFALLT